MEFWQTFSARVYLENQAALSQLASAGNEKWNEPCKLGPPARGPCSPNFFAWEGSPTKIDYRKKGTLILTSLLEDLVKPSNWWFSLKGLGSFHFTFPTCRTQEMEMVCV